MSGGATEGPGAGEAAPTGGGTRKRDSLGTAGSAAQLIIKDLGEIHSRLLDHRPIIQGEARYFVKEFEEKRGLREMRVLENLKHMTQETSEQTLPRCQEAMELSLRPLLQTVQAAAASASRLQQRERDRRQILNDHLIASEKKQRAQWEAFMTQQRGEQAAVDEEHSRALGRLRAQYAQMEKDLAKFSTF
ncbi:biogenesis of lysosome-related organelles complex 1 subunit 5-like [Talpa occidentalis]|uniref:biogenesis of lysosome-related organelles complex 1 subunit 5 n=1 Tax=Talpa occidentalis TaxID=50954 RepID=UPI00188F06F9|nr:biogenesis of lysosome-related organelles complex 1 subunit 5 [Talpa occidentalis]XP_037380232.1 biogenesis of lysosome-related organelles complex 1 subunit 5-like [Talpa occidentalis]